MSVSWEAGSLFIFFFSNSHLLFFFASESPLSLFFRDFARRRKCRPLLERIMTRAVRWSFWRRPQGSKKFPLASEPPASARIGETAPHQVRRRETVCVHICVCLCMRVCVCVFIDHGSKAKKTSLQMCPLCCGPGEGPQSKQGDFGLFSRLLFTIPVFLHFCVQVQGPMSSSSAV